MRNLSAACALTLGAMLLLAIMILVGEETQAASTSTPEPCQTPPPLETTTSTITTTTSSTTTTWNIEIKAPPSRIAKAWPYGSYSYYNGKNFSFFGVACSKSMVPTMDCGSKIRAFGVKGMPELLEGIVVGDIIAFGIGGNVSALHRIVYEGLDDEGRFFITKGDNNSYTDEGWYGKVREDEIMYLVVGVVY